jgi:RHS repeat-associated protein
MNTSNLKTANIFGSGLIGRVDLSGGATGGYYERMYYVKDHLGSIRVGISSVTTGNNNVTYACDYYPFGETQREYTSGSNKYKFTEKERDAESSYDYFGARYYNNKLGVWLSVDPLADKYPGFSPFNYCVNNPIRLLDRKGLAPELYLTGEDKNKDINALKEFAGNDGDRISSDDNGRIKFNLKGYKTGSNEGLDLLIKIDGAEEKIGFAISEKEPVLVTEGSNKAVVSSTLNASIQPRTETNPGAKPITKGMQGEVLVSLSVNHFTKDNRIVPISQIIGHELAENYQRTVNKENYFEAHEEANKIFYGNIDHRELKKK